MGEGVERVGGGEEKSHKKKFFFWIPILSDVWKILNIGGLFLRILREEKCNKEK